MKKKIAKLRFQRSNYLCLCAVVHSPSLTCEVRELNEKKNIVLVSKNFEFFALM